MKNRKQPLFKSFGYAFEGIWTGISKERNMKIHCLAVILVTAVGTFVGLTPMEWCICLLLFGMVISLELVNTAVEAVVDLVTEERKPLAKIAKDTAAGAVLFYGNHGCDHRGYHIYTSFHCTTVMERKATRKENKEMDENKVIVSTEMKQALVNLRNLEEIYVIMSGVTKMPFVLCDEETFDDEVLVYYQEESAKEKAKTLAEDRYHVGIAKIEKNARLGFFTNLYTMGVNALAVNVGTEEEIRVQLEHLVVRKNKEELPDGKKLIENPELHLTAMYLMQEMHRNIGPEMPENVKELQEEMMAHYKKGTFIVGVQEDNQVPLLRQPDGSLYQPIFTDMIEFTRFAQGKKMKTAAIPADKIPEILIPDAEGGCDQSIWRECTSGYYKSK